MANAARRANPSLPADLVALLEVPEGRRVSELERLRRPPTRTTGTSMAKALERADDLRLPPGPGEAGQGAAEPAGDAGPVGLGSKAPVLERAREPRRTALPTSVVRHLEASAIDDALDAFSLLKQVKLLNVAKRATDKEWLASRPRLAKASRTVQAVYRLWSEQLDLVAEAGTDLDAAALFLAVETEIGPRTEVEAAVRLLDELLPQGDDEAEAEMRRQPAGRYGTVRPFLSLLGESSALGAASGG